MDTPRSPPHSHTLLTSCHPHTPHSHVWHNSTLTPPTLPSSPTFLPHPPNSPNTSFLTPQLQCPLRPPHSHTPLHCHTHHPPPPPQEYLSSLLTHQESTGTRPVSVYLHMPRSDRRTDEQTDRHPGQRLSVLLLIGAIIMEEQ